MPEMVAINYNHNNLTIYLKVLLFIIIDPIGQEMYYTIYNFVHMIKRDFKVPVNVNHHRLATYLLVRGLWNRSQGDEESAIYNFMYREAVLKHIVAMSIDAPRRRYAQRER